VCACVCVCVYTPLCAHLTCQRISATARQPYFASTFPARDPAKKYTGNKRENYTAWHTLAPTHKNDTSKGLLRHSHMPSGPVSAILGLSVSELQEAEVRFLKDPNYERWNYPWHIERGVNRTGVNGYCIKTAPIFCATEKARPILIYIHTSTHAQHQ
jgi:hypothetical protein